jgi:hypothetical protein
VLVERDRLVPIWHRSGVMYGVTGVGTIQAGQARPSRPVAPADEAGSRALVTVDPVRPSERPLTPTRRPSAAFLAHLIASARNVPQMRERRRAEPDEAAAVYAARPAAAPAGRVVSRIT